MYKKNKKNRVYGFQKLDDFTIKMDGLNIQVNLNLSEGSFWVHWCTENGEHYKKAFMTLSYRRLNSKLIAQNFPL